MTNHDTDNIIEMQVNRKLNMQPDAAQDTAPEERVPHILQNDNCCPVQVDGDYCLNPGILQYSGGWEAAWEERQEQLDARLIDYLNELREYGEGAIWQLSEIIGDWLENEELQEKTAAEWQKIRQDGLILKTRIDRRVHELMLQGRLKIADYRKRDDDI